MAYILRTLFLKNTSGGLLLDYIETKNLKTQAIKPTFIYDIFFIWAESEENLNKFLEDLNKFHPNLKFTYEKSNEKNPFFGFSH